MLQQSPSFASTRLVDVAAAEQLFAPLAQEAREVLAVAYPDAEHCVLGIRHIRAGGRDALCVPVREIAADALSLDAVGVVIAHNHPSGDPTPSSADRVTTHELMQGLQALQVRLLDHLVVAQSGTTSFRSLGWL